MKKGFTLLEILLVIAAIGILAAIVIVAINPTRQLAQVRNAQRQNGARAIREAIGQNLIDTGVLIDGVDGVQRQVCATGILTDSDPLGSVDCQGKVDLRELVPTYLSSIPTSPSSTNNGAGFRVFTDSDGLRVFVIPDQIEAKRCPDNFIIVPGNPLYGTGDFCVMKYHAKDVGGIATSQASLTPWVNINYLDAMSACNSEGYRLMSNREWMTIARNIEGVEENWINGNVGDSAGLFVGHSDNVPSNSLPASSDDADGYFGTQDNLGSNPEQLRTFKLSNNQVIWDFSGNVFHWLNNLVLGEDIPFIDPADPNFSAGSTWYEWLVWNSNLNDYGDLEYDLLRSGDPSWDSNYGMGQFFRRGTAFTSLTTNYPLVRGGVYAYGANISGIYGTVIYDEQTAITAFAGFRCVTDVL